MEELKTCSSVIVLSSSRATYLSAALEKTENALERRELQKAVDKQLGLISAQGARLAGLMVQLRQCKACDLCSNSRVLPKTSLWGKILLFLFGKKGEVVDTRV